jgi:hypothetical protein
MSNQVSGSGIGETAAKVRRTPYAPTGWSGGGTLCEMVETLITSSTWRPAARSGGPTLDDSNGNSRPRIS